MPEPSSIDPANITALIAHRGRGNPVASHAGTAISNCFPGLEFDFRAVWKRILIGIELHEAENLVVGVESGGAAAIAGVQVGSAVVSIDGQTVVAVVRGPSQPGGVTQDLNQANLEWGNAISAIVARAGQTVECVFSNAGAGEITVALEVRKIFDGIGIADDAADPGTLTQGLCSPWQNDYRECGCYYWAASRPDFVNVEVSGGVAEGHNWMHKDRAPTTPKVYVRDGSGRPGQLTYEDLFQAWEEELRFVRRGQDSE